MLVSWNWLKEYVALNMDADEFAQRLTMAGLNHEGTRAVDQDLAIDLEVTSNRPDCLGHIGVAREASVLFQTPLQLPPGQPREQGTPVSELTNISLECPDTCYRYTARIIRGIKVGPSPDWLTNRLQTIGIAVINNIVDITNYVCMETGQPLHAFDLSLLDDQRIVVRQARPDEPFEAINHRDYALDPSMCVIADAKRAVALGGVMGGSPSEVNDQTVDLLIEAAEFSPISIRSTARKLNLHSPSSYRFERGVDPHGVDWASRRCCELILDLAGGELAPGVIDVGRRPPDRDPISLRWDQLSRILGIEIDNQTVVDILQSLGNQPTRQDSQALEVIPPTWRNDLTREIDLIEEVARIHGYDKIPEDARVPMVPSHRSDADRVLAMVRRVLIGSGFDEAMTYSVVSAEDAAAFSPWSSAAPLQTSTPMLQGANCLRRSLAPSLLAARRVNESLANPHVELFETARIYLPDNDNLPQEELMLAITSGSDFLTLKGVVEELVATIQPNATLQIHDTSHDLLDAARCAELRIDGELAGYMGEVSQSGRKQFSLRRPASIAEIRFTVLEKITNLKRQHCTQSPYPAVTRDLNLVVKESIRWSQIEETVRTAAGDFLEDIHFHEPYRDPEKDGPGTKRLLFSVTFRSTERTLTGEEIDKQREQIIADCHDRCGANLID